MFCSTETEHSSSQAEHSRGAATSAKFGGYLDKKLTIPKRV